MCFDVLLSLLFALCVDCQRSDFLDKWHSFVLFAWKGGHALDMQAILAIEVHGADIGDARLVGLSRDTNYLSDVVVGLVEPFAAEIEGFAFHFSHIHDSGDPDGFGLGGTAFHSHVERILIEHKVIELFVLVNAEFAIELLL